MFSFHKLCLDIFQLFVYKLYIDFLPKTTKHVMVFQAKLLSKTSCLIPSFLAYLLVPATNLRYF